MGFTSIVAAVLGSLMALLVGLVIVVLVVPVRLAAWASIQPDRLDASARADWGAGLAGLRATPRDGVHIQLLGRDVYRVARRAPRGDDAQKERHPEQRSGGWRPSFGFVRRVLRRTWTSLNPRGELSGCLGVGDPSDSAKLYGALAATRRWVPRLDTSQLEVDWMEPTAQVEGSLRATLWPIAITWILATEFLRPRRPRRAQERGMMKDTGIAKDTETLFESVVPELEALIKSNAVVGNTISVEERHAIPLVELTLSLGGGGGKGEGDDPDSGLHGQGSGAAAGGGAKATPVAVVVVTNNEVHINALGH